MNALQKISVVILQYCNGSLLPKGNLILQHMMYCNFKTNGRDASQQFYNTCIVL